VQSLRCSFGAVDPVLYLMTEMILPSLDGRGSFSELFLDYYCLLFCAHVTKAYGSSPISIKVCRGGLRPGRSGGLRNCSRNIWTVQCGSRRWQENVAFRSVISRDHSGEPLAGRRTNTGFCSGSKERKHCFRPPSAPSPKLHFKRGFLTKLRSAAPSKQLWELPPVNGGEKSVIEIVGSRTLSVRSRLALKDPGNRASTQW